MIPCLDEAASIVTCVRDGYEALAAVGLTGEVVVVDNGSRDGSGVLARDAGARVVHESVRGYGAALRAGFAAATGDYIVMADADATYDFGEIPRFVAALDHGADLVVGDRMGGIDHGAMPWLHRYVGNPLLTRLLNALFGSTVRDAHCGMRALRRDVLPNLDLRADGMEFASEMVVRAAKVGLRVAEVPIGYHPRVGTSKLSTVRDGWRHLRFLLVHAPLFLFVLPGAALAAAGTSIMSIVLLHLKVFGREWDIHTLVAGSLALLLGTQLLSLGACAHAYAVYHLGDSSRFFRVLRPRLRLEHGLAAGAVVTGAGIVAGATVVLRWFDSGFGGLSEESIAVLAMTLIVAGVQTIFASFLLSIIGLHRHAT